jgi:hypothetical protein
VKTIPDNFVTLVSEAVQDIRLSDPKMTIFDALRLGEKLVLEGQLAPDPNRRGLHAMAERYMAEHVGASYVDALREVSARHAKTFELATPTSTAGAGRSMDLILEDLERRGGQGALKLMVEERAAKMNEERLAEHAARGRGRATPTKTRAAVAPTPARGAPLDLAEGYGANADPQSGPLHAELAARARSYAAEHNVDYSVALAAVAAGAQEV